MYKNEVISGIGLSMTQNIIGSIIGGVGMYHVGKKYIKTDGWKLAGLVIVGTFVGSMIEASIALPKFKNV